MFCSNHLWVMRGWMSLKILPFLRAIFLAEDISLTPRLFLPVLYGNEVPHSSTISISTKLSNLDFKIVAISLAIYKSPSPILTVFFFESIPANKTDTNCTTFEGDDSTKQAISLCMYIIEIPILFPGSKPIASRSEYQGP